MGREDWSCVYIQRASDTATFDIRCKDGKYEVRFYRNSGLDPALQDVLLKNEMTPDNGKVYDKNTDSMLRLFDTEEDTFEFLKKITTVLHAYA
jgi:hypothetical protein